MLTKFRMMRSSARRLASLTLSRQQQAAQISTTAPLPVGGSGRSENDLIVGNSPGLPFRFRKIKQQNAEYFQRSGEKKVTEHTNTVLDPDYLDAMVFASKTKTRTRQRPHIPG